jgi:hypothetical protein
VFADGHQAVTTTVLDAEGDHALEMPSESPWPLALAFTIGLVFVFVLTDHWVTAGMCVLLVLASLVGWQTQKPWLHEEA